MEERIWTTKEGKEIEISQMETLHIENAIKMIEHMAEKGGEFVASYGYEGDDDFMTGDIEFVQGADYLKRIEEYPWLKEELAKRKTASH